MENENPSEEVVGQDAKDTSGRCATGVRTGQVVMEEQGALTWRDGCKRTGSTVYTVLPFFVPVPTSDMLAAHF